MQAAQSKLGPNSRGEKKTTAREFHLLTKVLQIMPKFLFREIANRCNAFGVRLIIKQEALSVRLSQGGFDTISACDRRTDRQTTDGRTDTRRQQIQR